MPGSCSSGLRSRPSGAGGTSRSKGFEVNSRNSRKPTLMSPMIDITRASNLSGKLRENIVTAKLHPPSINVHRSNEPSCDPHVAAIRYCSGNWELELVATFCTEKSLLTNDHARQPNASATNTACA